MLYHLLYPLRESFSGLNLFGYLTFRSFLGFLISLALTLILQPYLIAWVRNKQFGQPIRTDGPQRHLEKQGTPTMGGLVIIAVTIFTLLLLADLRNLYVWLAIAALSSFGSLGFADDYLKVSKKNTKGLRAKAKLRYQFLSAVLLMTALVYLAPDFPTTVSIPFVKGPGLDLGWLFIPFGSLVIVGASNAVNLTDGLDGLVIGPVMSVAFAYGIFAYTAGNAIVSQYLLIPEIPGAGDLAILAAALIGSGLGFLWYNCYPAEVFMGDVGALGIGATLGLLAVITKQELVLIVSGGVFVIEALSVIAQVTSFKLTGKRIFKMAPIHHHFELQGLSEPKIIVRCWIISIILALISIATLKIR